MKLTINHNGFHGRNSATIVVPDTAKPGDIVELSASVCNRLAKVACGVSSCLCGEGFEITGTRYMEDGTPRQSRKDVGYFQIPAEGREVRGNYPQS